MRIHNEPVHRGLITAMDPAVAPEGSLVRAVNARYRPADPAIWFAPGRRAVLSTLNGVVASPVPLVWDPGSTVSGVPNTPAELFQLLFLHLDTTAQTIQVKTIPALPNPTDPKMALQNATAYTLYNNTLPWETVLNQEFWEWATLIDQGNGDLLNYFIFIVDGSRPDLVPIPTKNAVRNLVMLRGRRQATGASVTNVAQRFIRHGIPDFPIGTTVVTGTGGGLWPVEWNRMFPFYWWVWYDDDNGHQGSTTAEAAVHPAAPVNTVSQLRKDVSIVLLPQDIPRGITHARLYRGGPAQQISGTTIIPNAFPYGKLIYSQAITEANYTSGVTLSYSDNHNDTIIDSKGDQTVFPIVQVRIGNQAVAVPRDGLPPLATTGDEFEESLVTDDVSDRRKIRFSYPGYPHSFPSIFYINFDTKDSDRVLWIRSLGNALGVGLQNSIWRVNWLPREADVEFNRGDVKTLVVEGFGAAGRKAVCKFQMPGSGPMLAWVSPSGLHATDLFEWKTLSQNIDWIKLIDVSALWNARLLNNPREYRLELYLPKQKLILYFHYHPTHLVDGLPAITQVERPGGFGDATLVSTEDADQKVITVAGRPKFFFEGFGTTDEADGSGLIMDVVTRDIYANGLSGEFRLTRGIGHFKPTLLTGGQVRFRFLVDEGGQASQDIITEYVRHLRLPQLNRRAEFVKIEVIGITSDSNMAINSLGFEWEDLGRVERGG